MMLVVNSKQVSVSACSTILADTLNLESVKIHNNSENTSSSRETLIVDRSLSIQEDLPYSSSTSSLGKPSKKPRTSSYGHKAQSYVSSDCKMSSPEAAIIEHGHSSQINLVNILLPKEKLIVHFVPQARIQRGDLGIYPPSIFWK